MMRKKIAAMMTAVCCLCTAVGVVPVSAANTSPRNYVVTKVVLDEDGSLNSVLVQRFGGDVYKLNEESTFFSVTLPEIPEIGDILNISTPKAVAGGSPYELMFEKAEDVEIINRGPAEELCEKQTLVVTEINRRTYTLESEDGTEFVFENDMQQYSYYTRMGAFDVGDSVEFLTMQGIPVIPAKPRLPFHFEEYLVIDEETGLLAQLTPAGAAEAYASEYPDMDALAAAKYGQSAIRWSNSLFPADDMPHNGDIVRITGLELVKTTFPAQMVYNENMTGEVLGSAEELGEVKPLLLKDRQDSSYTLVDADGMYYYYNERGLQHLEQGILDTFSEGDTVDCLVYQDMVVKAVGASAETLFPPTRYAVVREWEESYILRRLDGMSTFGYSKTNIAKMLADNQKMPEYGDIITIQGNRMSTSLAGTNNLKTYLNFDRFTAGQGHDGVVKNLCSAFEQPVEKEFTVTEQNRVLSAKAEDGTNFSTYIDFLPDDSALKNAKIGDTLTMLTYDGYAVVPVSDGPVEQPQGILGDVNADNTLDLLDVLAVSRHLLIGEPLPALSGAKDTGLGQCDFDGDGAITQLDALNMLKRVIGLA